MFNSGNFNRFFFVCPFPKGSKKEALNRFQRFFAPTLKGESFEDSKGYTAYSNLKIFEVTFLSFFKTIFNLAPPSAVRQGLGSGQNFLKILNYTYQQLFYFS